MRRWSVKLGCDSPFARSSSQQLCGLSMRHTCLLTVYSTDQDAGAVQFNEHVESWWSSLLQKIKLKCCEPAFTFAPPALSYKVSHSLSFVSLADEVVRQAVWQQWHRGARVLFCILGTYLNATLLLWLPVLPGLCSLHSCCDIPGWHCRGWSQHFENSSFVENCPLDLYPSMEESLWS